MIGENINNQEFFSDIDVIKIRKNLFYGTMLMAGMQNKSLKKTIYKLDVVCKC